MPRRLPPLNSLPSFEAAARLLSMSRAADELGVTHGAAAAVAADHGVEAGRGIVQVRQMVGGEREAAAPAVFPCDAAQRGENAFGGAAQPCKIRLRLMQ